jgi:DNA-binding winged helix-turn-helix (wHTH) protein
MNNEKIRFGPFELDPRAGELRRGHRRVRLQERPLKMLVALLANPGEVVTREELRMRLWPAKMFVDFDNGLNNAVNKLRTALGDSAAKPEYIETVGRRGYRFIGSVIEAETPPMRSPPTPVDTAEGASAIGPAPERPPEGSIPSPARRFHRRSSQGPPSLRRSSRRWYSSAATPAMPYRASTLSPCCRSRTSRAIPSRSISPTA